MSILRTATTTALFTTALALVAAPAAAESKTWDAGNMTAAASYFPKSASAMIIGIGAAGRPVAAQLLASLQQSSDIELAIDGRSLGAVDELDDAALVKRAFNRPIQRLAIVRVFPAAGTSKAVGTIYGAQGQVTSAFTLVPDRALAENATPEAAEHGVGRDELANVQGATGKGSPMDKTDASSDEITYERHQIVGVSMYGVMTFEHVNFSKGGRLIADTPGLYEAMGMKDRADQFRTQEAEHASGIKKGVALMSVGTLGVIGFGTWWLVSAISTDSEYDPVKRDWVEKESDTLLPMALTAGSTALIVAGVLVARGNPRPERLSADDAIKLVDDYNAKRKRSVAFEPKRDRLVRDVQWAPTALRGGGGLVLGGSF